MPESEGASLEAPLLREVSMQREIALQRELSIRYPSDHPHLAHYESALVLEPPLRRPYPLCCIIVGVVLIAIGLAFPARYDGAVRDAVWDQTRLNSPQAPSFPGFERERRASDSDEVVLRVYVFHCTNARAVVTHGAKPELEERGPYVYSIAIDHLNATFVRDGDVEELFFVAWQQLRLLRNGPDAGRDDAELLTTVNVPFQIVLANAPDDAVVEAFYGKELAHDAASVVFTTRPVREHLFGYDGAFARHTEGVFARSPVSGTHYPGFVQNFSSETAALAALGFDALRVDRPHSHAYSVWQGSSEVKRCKTCVDALWASHEANRVGGSDGKLIADLNKPQVWLPALVRRVDLERAPHGMRHAHRDTHVFTLAAHTFANASSYPANAAYYATAQPDGLLHMSRLLMGVPAFASKPHFLHGAPELLDGVVGVSPPMAQEHETLFEVHAETGVSVLVAERFQYNIRLAPRPRLAALARVPTVYTPMFWFETLERLSRKHESLFARCDNLTEASRALSVSCIALGVAFLLAGFSWATLNAEKDAVANQRHAVEVERAAGEFMAPVEPAQVGRTGLDLMWHTPSLARGWGSSVAVATFMNVLIQSVSLRDEARVRMKDAAWQVALTAYLVAYFATVGGVSVARAAYKRGEFPRRRVPMALVDDALRCSPRGCVSLPLRASTNACYLGVSVGLFVALVVGAPVAVAMLAACADCGVPKYEFVFGKAAMAGALMLVVFPLAALRTLAADL